MREVERGKQRDKASVCVCERVCVCVCVCVRERERENISQSRVCPFLNPAVKANQSNRLK
jgi:hypothetical protein